MKNLFLSVVMCVLAFTVNAQYKVGDIYNKDGIKGIVVSVTDGGNHGLIMSLEGSGKRWLSDKEAKFETGAFHEDDGQKNMDAIEKYIQENNKSWEDFPIFEWVKSLGNGWYLPAKEELLEIVKNINGGTLEYSQKTIKDFDQKLKKAKGQPMISNGMAKINEFNTMYTSTECEGGLVHSLWLKEKTGSALKGVALGRMQGQKKGTLEIIPRLKTFGGKMGGFYSRAIHKF